MNNLNSGRFLADDIWVDDTARVNCIATAIMGRHIAIGYCVYISTQFEFKSYIHIAPFVSIIGGVASKVKMGYFTNISSGCRIICNSDNYYNSLGGPFDKYSETINKEVIFEGFNLIGSNSIIMPGVNMAIGSACCAGTILTKNTEPWTLYAGNGLAIKLRDKETILKKAENYNV